MQEMPFQRPKFQKISGGHAPGLPLKLRRQYGLPLIKILATPLDIYKSKYKKVSLLPFIGPSFLSDKGPISSKR